MLPEHAVDHREHLPEPTRLCRIVRVVDAISGKRDRVRDLGWHDRDRHLDVKPLQRTHHVVVELSDRSAKNSPLDPAVAGAKYEDVVEKVELTLQSPNTDRHR